ncbi:hypothetical protein P7K49_001583 [Saguinus oedipus]|uniref:Uncharacterized protein n=1 Tax=Saguinus oedipus TaxID=9490 RepID=A0ABQ9WEW5_SAGOE|nr:hypothetical protein P7K49_001583 [Saguinus oedipus]
MRRSGGFVPALTWLCHASPLPQVNLFSDPPQPSRSIHTGMVPQGTKVLSFTIPQPRSAEWWPSPAEDPQASVAAGWPSARGDLSPSLPTSKPTLGWLPENRGISKDQSSAEQTQALASQARQFLAKVSGLPALPPRDLTHLENTEALPAWVRGALGASLVIPLPLHRVNSAVPKT